MKLISAFPFAAVSLLSFVPQAVCGSVSALGRSGPPSMSFQLGIVAYCCCGIVHAFCFSIPFLSATSGRRQELGTDPDKTILKKSY